MKKIVLATIAAILISGCTFGDQLVKPIESREYLASGMKARSYYNLRLEDTKTGEVTRKYIASGCATRIFNAGEPRRKVNLNTWYEKNEQGETIKVIDTETICRKPQGV